MKTEPVLNYQRQTCNQAQILEHFSQCDPIFVANISNRTPIAEYARKVVEKSTTFEAWTDHKLVGLIAAYINDPDGVQAFITNVSVVTHYARMGIASKLLKNCVSFAQERGFKEILLEVAEDNPNAINFYVKHSFEVIKRQNTFVQMKLTLEKI